MYKIEHFEEKFCGANSNSYCFANNNNNCDGYSIWQFCPWKRWQTLKQLVNFPENLSLCRPEWFALIFWLSLILSLGGIYYSGKELLAVYYGSWNLMKTDDKDEQLQMISPVVQRNARLISAALMVKAWMGLFIGISTVTPSAISTWLAIYSVTIFVHLILWIGETLFVKNKLDFRSCCKHLMPVGTLLLVRCVHGVFIREIERRANIEELDLLTKLGKNW
ncbi:uncharacterized protein LOC129918217 [Episyrphus balteatus]|uniref:uncharacterized protein LOC129918217 n=1 Tax=Episyrphus balteatus TaxID=286459 RepID=UPI002486034E|nr:uncharacterized protein LOC129918217 [Episyrphus balteatus]